MDLFTLKAFNKICFCVASDKNRESNKMMMMPMIESSCWRFIIIIPIGFKLNGKQTIRTYSGTDIFVTASNCFVLNALFISIHTYTTAVSVCRDQDESITYHYIRLEKKMDFTSNWSNESFFENPCTHTHTNIQSLFTGAIPTMVSVS